MDEQNETLEIDQQEVDAAWEEDTNPPPTEEEAPAQSSTDGEPEVNEQPKEESGQADQPALFTLKHMDEIRQVGKEEVVSLAQKGMDYDRIRTERDQLRTYRQKADPALNLVKAYAQHNGMDIPAYIDYCRKRELMAQGVDEQTAAARVEVEKGQAILSTQNAEAEALRQRQEQERQESERRSGERQRDMSAFLSAYPDVKPEAIPPQVWERVARGESLMSAYTMHQNAELKARLAAQQQNRQNQQRSPGGLSTTEQKGGKSISDLWDDAEY